MDAFVHYVRAQAFNNAWANHRLLSACAQLSPADFEAPRVGFFPFFEADRASASCAELQARQSAIDGELIAPCEALDVAALRRDRDLAGRGISATRSA